MALALGYAQSLTYPAALDRRIIGASLAHTTGVGLRSGVLPANGEPLKVSATTGLGLAVAAGPAAIDPYTAINDSTAAMAPGGTFANGVSSGVQTVTTARWDLVILRLYDTEAGHAGPSRAVLEVVRGSTTADPAVPVPAYSLLLARVRLSASQSTITNANIDDLRVYTAAAGGVVQVPGGLATPSLLAGLPAGTPFWDSTAGKSGLWTGSVAHFTQRGIFTAAFAGAQAVLGSETFPIPFGAVPTVMLTARAITGTRSFVPNLRATPTTTGFTWKADVTDNGPVAPSGEIHWLAVLG